MDPRRLGLGGSTATLILVAWHLVAPATPASDPAPAPLPRWSPAPPSTSASTVGAGRCSAVACHGSALPVAGSRIFHDEHTTWITRDPHTEAYQVLHSELSQNIVRLLNKRAEKPVPAYEDDRCLVCHATATRPVATRQATLQDGVGCESCHGPAKHWLELHTTDAWATIPASEKEERFGMYQTDSLARRAAVCAGCHVGGPSENGRPPRDVDHDLIAAGHPRLAFEFSGMLANLPPHWNEKGRNAAPDFPARAWAIGQVVSARAALDQLANRATAAEQSSGRWPELAEYDCASCHHDLNASIASRTASRTGLGTPPWGDWYYSMTHVVRDSFARTQPGVFDHHFNELAHAMSAPAPDPRKIAADAAELSTELARWLPQLSDEAFEPSRFSGLIREISSTRNPRSRDAVFQQYLALIPLRQALKAQNHDDPELLRTIETLREQLRRSQVSARVPMEHGVADTQR